MARARHPREGLIFSISLSMMSCPSPGVPVSPRCQTGIWAVLDWTCQSHHHSSAATANPSVLLLLLCPRSQGDTNPPCQGDSGQCSPRGQCSCHCFIHRPTLCAPAKPCPWHLLPFCLHCELHIFQHRFLRLIKESGGLSGIYQALQISIQNIFS